MLEEKLKMMCIVGLITCVPIFNIGCTKQTVPGDSLGKSTEQTPSQQARITSPMDNIQPEPQGEVEPIETDYSDPTNNELKQKNTIRTHKGMVPVFFNFSDKNIRTDQKESLEQNADFMNKHQDYIITIEGNTDERGTNEYNTALGLARAQAAKQYLIYLGIADTRIEVLSFGEDQPFKLGHNETSWSQNRRDDFVVHIQKK